eukprot:440468-Rhodomonas_salina.3
MAAQPGTLNPVSPGQSSDGGWTVWATRSVAAPSWPCLECVASCRSRDNAGGTEPAKSGVEPDVTPCEASHLV